MKFLFFSSKVNNNEDYKKRNKIKNESTDNIICHRN